MEYLFTYGVFRDISLPLLGSYIFCDKAYVFGELYHVNEFYPGYIRKSCDNKVYGDVYLIDPILFEALDEYEGEEYERKKIWCSLGIEVWIYEYIDDVTPFKEIKTGDWMLR